MSTDRKFLPVTFALDPELTLRDEFGDGQFITNQKRLATEQEQQLIEEMKQQTLQVIAARLDLWTLLDLNVGQLGHVAEHGDATLLERLLQTVAPGM